MSTNKQLEKSLGIVFKNKALLTLSLTHRSYLNEHPEIKQSNERLEFLGDALLEVWVSKKLFVKFSDLPEGVLTNLRAAIVKTKTLAGLAQKINLGEFLLLSKGEEASNGRKNISLLADCFEAVIGAIFCDQGDKAVDKFLTKIVLPEINNLSLDELKDFKSLFQEITQKKFKITPHYQVVSREGPDHDRTFTVSVLLKEKQVGVGKGKSKQSAETKAAKDALEKLELK